MIKTLTVFGTRPEAIKMAPLVKALDASPAFENHVCVTAQHREMLDQVLALFDIKPDFDLNVMKKNQDLFTLTANVILSIRTVFKDTAPDLVLVQGDTTTTFTTALGTFYEGIALGHVEAGLRTGNLKAPFPEEGNRVLTSRLASLHFCPTETNQQNLVAEGVDLSHIRVTGNTVIDALLWVSNRVKNLSAETWRDTFGNAAPAIDSGNPIVLITGHRRENFGSGFEHICQAIHQLATRNKDWHFIYPVHLNPNVSKPVHDLLSDLFNVHLIKPLDYAPFVFLMNQSRLILTDSGGVQEEAPSLGKPVLVMREVTERQEGVDAGTVQLVGTNTEKIVKSVESLMTDETIYRNMSQAINPYGDGNASKRILEAITEYMSNDKRG